MSKEPKKFRSTITGNIYTLKDIDENSVEITLAYINPGDVGKSMTLDKNALKCFKLEPIDKE